MDAPVRSTLPDVATTHAQWESVSASFSLARPRPWPAVVQWAERTFAPGDRVLDLGAGNGRHASPLRDRGVEVVAADFALDAVREARAARNLETVRAEATHLPFRSRSFDGALFVAALHNVPGSHRRIGAAAEVARVLAPGGRALVTVWSRWRAGWIRHFMLEVPHRVFGDGAGSFGDVVVPWRVGAREHPRYYHFYSRPELRADLEAAGLEVEALWGERLAIPRSARWPGRALPDNLFAAVRKPGS